MSDSILNFSDLGTAQRREVAILRKILANQTVRVLVGAAPPGSVSVGEEHGGFQRSRDFLMVRKLLAIVKSQGLNTHNHRTQPALNDLLCLFGRLPGQLAHAQESRFSFHQSHNGTPMPFSNDRVAFPVADSLARISSFGPLFDADPA